VGPQQDQVVDKTTPKRGRAAKVGRCEENSRFLPTEIPGKPIGTARGLTFR